MRSDPENRPEISVIVCTRNRATTLARNLHAFAGMETVGFSYEFILIDNGSEDETKKIFEVFQRENPAFPGRYFFEPERGLARARNRGIREARGGILAFTDDDITPDREWLKEIVAYFKAHPRISGIFGFVAAAEGVSPLYAIKQKENEEIFSHRRDAFRAGHGNNMAFHRELFSEIGLFDPRLGAGSERESAEDTEFAFRALDRGFQLAYLSSARVTHHPDLSRGLQDLIRGYDRGLAFFLGNYFGKGELDAMKILIGQVRAILLGRLHRALRRPGADSVEAVAQTQIRRIPRLCFSFLLGIHERVRSR